MKRTHKAAQRGQRRRNELVRLIRELGMFRPRLVPHKHLQKKKVTIRNYETEKYSED